MYIPHSNISAIGDSKESLTGVTGLLCCGHLLNLCALKSTHVGKSENSFSCCITSNHKLNPVFHFWAAETGSWRSWPKCFNFEPEGEDKVPPKRVRCFRSVLREHSSGSLGGCIPPQAFFPLVSFSCRTLQTTVKRRHEGDFIFLFRSEARGKTLFTLLSSWEAKHRTLVLTWGSAVFIPLLTAAYTGPSRANYIPLLTLLCI